MGLIEVGVDMGLILGCVGMRLIEVGCLYGVN